MKMAPIIAALKGRDGVRQVLVHTGQHYDVKMSDVFFQDLGMPDPDVHLGVGSGSHAQQTAKIMLEIEPVLLREKPDVVVVAGDVNSTIGVALVAAKLGLRIAHVEAGLRSRLPVGFSARDVKLIERLGYLDFLALTAEARLVMTDSGGIQEETTALGVPCLTLRENTERPITVEVGTNQLVGTDPARVIPAAREVLAGRGKKGRIPELWDGHAAERVAGVLVR